jgi:hypothetical protein
MTSAQKKDILVEDPNTDDEATSHDVPLRRIGPGGGT